MSTDHVVLGVVGFFKDPAQLVEATRKTREANYESFDAYTPYPIHGLEKAQGLKRSFLPWVTFCAGIAGACLGFGLQYWTSAVDWPLNVGGKPFNSWPAFVPVMFEFTILLAGLSTVGAMFFVNGFPNIKRKSVDPGITRDRFALMIDAPPQTDPHSDEAPKNFDLYAATEFLKKLGAEEVRPVRQEGWF